MTENLKATYKMIYDAYNVPINILNNKNNHISSHGDYVKHPLFPKGAEILTSNLTAPLLMLLKYITYIQHHIKPFTYSINTIFITELIRHQLKELNLSYN